MTINSLKIITTCCILVASSHAISAQVESCELKRNGKVIGQGVFEELETSGLGDVKYSILSRSAFTRVNGDEWVLMHGQSKSNIKVINSKDKETVFKYMHYGYVNDINESSSNLPDTSEGHFLRPLDFKYIKKYKSESCEWNDFYEEEYCDFSGLDELIGKQQEMNFKGFNLKNNKKSSNGYDYEQYMGKSTTSYVGNLFGGSWQHPAGSLSLKWDDSEIRPKSIPVNTFVKVKRKCIKKQADSKIQEMIRKEIVKIYRIIKSL